MGHLWAFMLKAKKMSDPRGQLILPKYFFFIKYSMIYPSKLPSSLLIEICMSIICFVLAYPPAGSNVVLQVV